MSNCRNIVVCGELGVGKSTVCGHFMRCANALDDNILLEAKQSGESILEPERALAFSFDKVKIERDQLVTVKCTRRYLKLECGMNLALIDTPGLRKYMKNLVKALFHCDIVFLVVDGSKFEESMKSNGHFEYSYYSQIIQLATTIGVEQFVILVNNIDHRFTMEEELCDLMTKIAKRFRSKSLRISATDDLGFDVFPVFPFSNVNSLHHTIYGGWSLAEFLEDSNPFCPQSTIDELLFAISDVKIMKGKGHIVVGRVISGQLHVNSTVYIGPFGYVTSVRDIVCFGGNIEVAKSGDFVSFLIDDLYNITAGMVATVFSNSSEDLLRSVSCFNATLVLTECKINFSLKVGSQLLLDAHNIHTTCTIKSLEISKSSGDLLTLIHVSENDTFFVMPSNVCTYFGVFCLRHLNNIVAVGKVTSIAEFDYSV